MTVAKQIRSAFPTLGDKNDGLGALIARYECGPVTLTGTDEALYERRPASYTATRSRVSDPYVDRRDRGRKAILNVARSGKFSSDRTIAEYAMTIRTATPCPVGGRGPDMQHLLLSSPQMKHSRQSGD